MEDIIKIAICEDSKDDEDKLLGILSQCPIKNQSDVFHCAEDLLKVYVPGDYDLLLTDIYMGNMTGVELVSRIREFDETIPIAFVTTSTDFALDGYRLSVIKYIEKPYRQKDIEDIMRIALLEKQNAPSLVLHKNGNEVRIPFSRIVYMEQQTHKLHIYLKDGTSVTLYEKLSSVLTMLDEEMFFSPHKSFCVNLSCVRYVDPDLKCFMMENDKNVPIRRESMGKAKKALENYLFNRTRGI